MRLQQPGNRILAPGKFVVCCNLFTYVALRSSQEFAEMRPCVPDRIGIWRRWFLRRGRNRSTRRKTSSSKGEDQQQTQPTWHRGQDSNQSHTGGSNAPPLLPQRASRTPCAFKHIQKNGKYSPRRKRKDSKGRSINLDLINIVFAFVALNVAVATFLKGLLMLDKQDLRTRVGEHISQNLAHT